MHALLDRTPPDVPVESGFVPHTSRPWLPTAWEFARFGWQFFVRRQDRPFLMGLMLTDACNLSCRHCRVANTGQGHMPWDEIEARLRGAYERDVRFLYLSGGEPYLWRDAGRQLPDVIALARRIGFLRVHVLTNGTHPLSRAADLHWVSLDGLGDVQMQLRGASTETVTRNILAFTGRLAVIFTVNTVNRGLIREFLDWARHALPRRRVLFFFHTPYYGVDALHLTDKQRGDVIEDLLRCKREGMPVVNSAAALRAIQTGRYRHPTALWFVADRDGDHLCCRARSPEVCRHCGYSSCAEMVLAQGWHPGVLGSALAGV